MATAATRSSIIQLVVLATNQAPGTTLLTTLILASDAGQTLAQIAATLTGAASFTAKYPIFQTNEEFGVEYINEIIPAATAEVRADAAVLVAGLLNSGSSRADVVLASSEFLAVAPTADPSFGTAAATFQNKAAVATYHTITLELDTALDTALVGVTEDPATVTTAEATLDATPAVTPVAQTFTLTSTLDNIAGTGANEAVSAILATAAADSTWNIADTIDLAGGTDSLNVRIINDGTDFTGRTAAGAEILNITSVDTSDNSVDDTTFGISGLSGLTQVWVKDSTVSGAADDVVQVTGVGSTATVGLANNDSDLDVSFTTTGSATSGDSISLALAGGATGDVTINDGANDGYATINLTTSTAASSLSSLKSTDLTTLNILGDQKFTSIGLDSDIKTLDASANTAGVTVNATASTTLKATGTAVADTLALTVPSSIVSGMAVSAFETVSLYASASASLDMDQFTGVTTTAFSSVTGANGNVLTLTDTAASPTLVFAGAGKSTSTGTFNGATVALKDSSGTSDTVTFSITNLGVSAGTGDATVGALTAAGVETINIVADNFDDVTIGNSTFANAKTINYSGSGDTTFGTLSTAALTSFAGSSATGDLTLGTVNNVAVDSTIALGSGKDTVTTPTAVTANKTMTITTAAGDDTVTLQDSTTGVGTTAGELGTVDLNTGDGTDTVTLSSLATANVGDTKFKLDGGAGDQDLFQVTAAVATGSINIDLFDNFEKINLLGAQNNAIGLTVPTGYADSVLVTNVQTANAPTLTINASIGGTASIAKFTFLGTVPALTVAGTTGAETLTGNANSTTITGAGGNDTITGGAAVDTITGGTGADTINGAAGADIINIPSGDSTSASLDKVTYGTADVLNLNTALASLTPSGGADLTTGANIASTGTTAATLLTDLTTVANALAANAFDHAGDTFFVTLTGDSVGGTTSKYLVHNTGADTAVTVADTIIQLIGDVVPTATANIV